MSIQGFMTEEPLEINDSTKTLIIELLVLAEVGVPYPLHQAMRRIITPEESTYCLEAEILSRLSDNGQGAIGHMYIQTLARHYGSTGGVTKAAPR